MRVALVFTEEFVNMISFKRTNERQEGRVLVPALLWMAGVPFSLVLLLWLFFFRG